MVPMSGTVNQNITKFLDFAISQGLWVADPWCQHPQAHHWTWYSYTDGLAKDIVFFDGCWRIIQNCRVYRSAQFLNTDFRLVVATLKLQLQSGRMVPSQLRLDVGKLNDERVAEELGNRLSGDLGVWVLWGNPEELWSAFVTTILDVASGCLGTHRRVKNNSVSQGTLNTIDSNRRARLHGRAELFRELRRKTVRAPRLDKEADV